SGQLQLSTQSTDDYGTISSQGSGTWQAVNTHPTSGTGGGPSQTLHPRTALGRQLLLLEGTLYVNDLLRGEAPKMRGGWFWQRNTWLQKVQRATTAAQFRPLILQLVRYIDAAAVRPSWRGQLGAWLSRAQH